VKCVLHFCKFLANPNIDLVLNCVFGKPMKRRFQRRVVHAEILSTFHAQIEYISVKNVPLKPMGQWGQNSLKPPLLLAARGPSSNTPVPRLTLLTTPNERQLVWFTHFHTTMQQRPHWLQWHAPNLPQNCSFLFDNYHPI